MTLRERKRFSIHAHTHLARQGFPFLLSYHLSILLCTMWLYKFVRTPIKSIIKSYIYRMHNENKEERYHLKSKKYHILPSFRPSQIPSTTVTSKDMNCTGNNRKNQKNN